MPIGEIFSFLSGLYFRGKMAYVRRFAEKGNAFVITSNQGMVSVDTPVSLPELQAFSEVEIDFKNESYRRPLEIDLAGWSRRKDMEFVLLGSIASPKYTKVLVPFLQERLYVPKPFRGLGDMSRGALMLRHAAENVEMEYVALSSLADSSFTPLEPRQKRGPRNKGSASPAPCASSGAG